LTKLGEQEDAEGLAGTEFKLLDEEGNLVEEGLLTDESGEVSIENLKPGDYQLVETKASFGYVLDETPLSVNVPFNPQEPVAVEMMNKLQTGSVELTKRDYDDETIIEGATFSLQDREGNVLQEKLLTNEEGIIFAEDLKPGEYQFVETEPALGYDLNAT
ncbi:collagen binding domain-containing protein, partial [Anaerobacillus sp. 1_MG-2023]|uniref:MSCRAMM family protein n=1 Tax=Anaerobacillus sp. 1_MG-2023 TaxID=3062655 RepID=UPI0026E1B057